MGSQFYRHIIYATWDWSVSWSNLWSNIDKLDRCQGTTVVKNTQLHFDFYSIYRLYVPYLRFILLLCIYFFCWYLYFFTEKVQPKSEVYSDWITYLNLLSVSGLTHPFRFSQFFCYKFVLQTSIQKKYSLDIHRERHTIEALMGTRLCA